MTPKAPFYRRKWFIFIVLAIASTAIKARVSFLGYNYDVDAFTRVSDLILRGENLYAETTRFIFGPVWAYLAGAIRYIQVSIFNDFSPEIFHLLITLFLSLVDIAIGFVLWRFFSFGAGCLFVVNPVSLLLTGYHSQIENLAILPGIIACGLLAPPGKNLTGRFWAGVGLLGLSLSTKHVLFLLPVWFLFNKSLDKRKRLIVFLFPYIIFGASFAPFIIGNPDAFNWVFNHILKYDSLHLGGFYPQLVHLFFPVKFFDKALNWVPIFWGFKCIWLVTLVAVGWLVRNESPPKSLLLYLIALCVFSSALADQYLAIPLASCAVFWNYRSIRWYLFVATLYLAISPHNIGSLPAMSWLAAPTQSIGFEIWHPVTGLFIFLIVYFCKPRLRWVTKQERESGENARKENSAEY